MSVAVPLVLCSVNVPLVSTVKTTRPTYSVVEGPAGTSVGNRIKTLCPVTSHVCDPSAFSVMCSTAPFAFNWTVSPVRRFVKANVFPFPAVRMRTTFPFLSVNSLNTRFVLFQISTRRGKEQAAPAGRSITVSGGGEGPAAMDLVAEPANAINVAAAARASRALDVLVMSHLQVVRDHA